MTNYIFGLHEPGGEYLMLDAGKPGTILFLAEIGHSSDPHAGMNLAPWASKGFTTIVRIQHGWGNGGCLPLPEHLEAFLQRVASLVRNSRGCSIWLPGNEPNLPVEWPDKKPLTPVYVAQVYDRCRELIHAQPGHESDVVLLPPVGPWNAESGIGWVAYFEHMIAACKGIDGFALHTYTHGTDPALVTSDAKMGAPYQNCHYNFRAYRDFMNAIPAKYRRLPVYITETDENEPWENANRGWVQAAYREIDAWNRVPGNQQIRALVLYRWPRYDQWHIDGKPGVHDDFRAAMEHEYVWRDEPTPQPTELERLRAEVATLKTERDALKAKITRAQAELR